MLEFGAHKNAGYGHAVLSCCYPELMIIALSIKRKYHLELSGSCSFIFILIWGDSSLLYDFTVVLSYMFILTKR